MPAHAKWPLFNGMDRVYNWDAWLDGQIWKFTEGEDFATTPVTFAKAARQAAARRGLEVRTKTKEVDGVGYVWIQMIGALPWEKMPKTIQREMKKQRAARKAAEKVSHGAVNTPMELMTPEQRDREMERLIAAQRPKGDMIRGTRGDAPGK